MPTWKYFDWAMSGFGSRRIFAIVYHKRCQNPRQFRPTLQFVKTPHVEYFYSFDSNTAAPSHDINNATSLLSQTRAWLWNIKISVRFLYEVLHHFNGPVKLWMERAYATQGKTIALRWRVVPQSWRF